MTALVLIVSGLVYVALWDTPLDTMYNMRRGAVACVVIFVLIGVINMPDGPFVRPHPGAGEGRRALDAKANALLFFSFARDMCAPPTITMTAQWCGGWPFVS